MGKYISHSKYFGLSKIELRKKVSGVYKITCLINDKVYIGQSDDIYKRWRAHLHSMRGTGYGNKLLIEDAFKYGIENFKFEILEVCESGFHAYYGRIENKYMELYGSLNRDKGYNLYY